MVESDVKVGDTGNSDDSHDPEYEAAVAKQKKLAAVLRKQR